VVFCERGRELAKEVQKNEGSNASFWLLFVAPFSPKKRKRKSFLQILGGLGEQEQPLPNFHF
jgi:hypothetical protein